MANIRLIKGRIKSAKNIAQITKAMELVAASKMKKAQAAALSGKAYADKIYETTIRLAAKVDLSLHPMLSKPKIPTGRRLLVLVSTNKGLCGGLNTNLFRFYLREYKDIAGVDFVTVGSKGADFLVRMGRQVKADFSSVVPFARIIPALNDYIVSEFYSINYDSVEIMYNDFLSALKQIPRRKTILPLTIGKSVPDELKGGLRNVTLEPNANDLFESLLPHYLENQIRDAIHEAEASEHSARMLAMRNATDNAKSLTEELTLIYNKVRQEKITYEITDMVTARLAVS